MHSRKPLLLVLFFVATSCSPPEYLSEKELAQYVSKHDDFSKLITTNDVAVKAIFWPTDLLAAQEFGAATEPTESQIREAQAKYRDHYYFVISISRGGKEIISASALGAGQFSNLLQTVSFRMSNLVNLTTSDQDTIPVADYLYNRTFGLSGSTDLLFAFDKSIASKQEWIQINLDEFGLGIGRQSLRFNVDDLESTPRIYKK